MHLPGRITRSVKEHRAIIEGLKSRRPERAEKAARAHMAAVITDFVREKSENSELQPDDPRDP
jgi:DNA-binding GntR family transcriptional regulator